MIAGVVYDPNQWRDFFTMVGGASAALTGLVFVAMSLNVRTVTQDPTHRYRAIGTLTAFVAVFMISAFALMGNQTHVGLGAAWLIIAAGAEPFTLTATFKHSNRVEASGVCIASGSS